MSSHNCDNYMYQCPHYDNDQIHCHQHVKGDNVWKLKF